jgi:hypothetical protein
MATLGFFFSLVMGELEPVFPKEKNLCTLRTSFFPLFPVP